MGCSESTPKGKKAGGTAPVRQTAAKDQQPSPKEKEQKTDAQNASSDAAPEKPLEAPRGPPPSTAPRVASEDAYRVPGESLKSRDPADDINLDRSTKSLRGSMKSNRNRSPRDPPLDVRSMSSEDTSHQLNVSQQGLVRCATLNMSFSHGSPQGGSKPQAPPSVSTVKQIVGDKAMIDQLEESVRMSRDAMPPLLGAGLNGNAASPQSEKTAHSITVSIPPLTASCASELQTLENVQQILSDESDGIIDSESGSESNDTAPKREPSQRRDPKRDDKGPTTPRLLSPEPSGNLYQASSRSLMRLRSLRQTSHAMSFTTDFLAKSTNGGQYMLKITACDPEPTKRKELDTLQGHWEDLARNSWSVKDRKATVSVSETGELKNFTLEDSKDYNFLGKVLLMGAKVLRHEWSQIIWSDGDEWQQVWTSGAEVDVYYGEEEGWFAGKIHKRDADGKYSVLFEDGEIASDVEGAHMRDREDQPLQGIYLMPPENPY